MTDKRRKYRWNVSSERQAKVSTDWLLIHPEGRLDKIKVNIDPEAKYRFIRELTLDDIKEYEEIIAHAEIVEEHDVSESLEVLEVPQKAEPPAAADFIITAMMGSKAADAAIGDLTEVFRKDIDSGMSLTRAKAKYWGEVFFLAGPMLKELAKRFGLMVLAGKLLG